MLSWIFSENVDKFSKSRTYFQEIWKQMATHRAIWLFHELSIANIIGDSTISIYELCEKSQCCNTAAFASLLMVLNAAKIVVIESQDDTMMIRLHENGAMLQQALMNDVNLSLLVSCMGSADVDATWQNLRAVLTQKNPPSINATSAMYDMINADFMNSHWKEVQQVFTYEEDSLQDAKIGVWSVDKHIHLLKEILPTSTIIHVDEDSVEHEQDLDALVLHRVIGVFYNNNFVRRCLSALKDGGRLFIVDAVPFSPQSTVDVDGHLTCVNELYTHASMFGQNFSVNQLIEMFSNAFDVQHVLTLEPYVMALCMQKLSIV